MGFFRDLFSKKDVSARELKVALIGVERERKRKQMELRKVASRQNDMVDRVKKARKSGNGLEVDYLWEDLKAMKFDGAFLKREVKVLNLEGIALKRYVRGMERLERSNNKEGIRKLLERMRSSGLDTKLANQFINDQEYLDELGAIMEEVGMEAEQLESAEDEPAKVKFLQQIDALNSAEESGDLDKALQHEETIKAELEKEPEEES
ncbi:MAG: hypothetical protein MUC63_03100 [Planctomycetes bacterium]|nr:hypothetical protein [Planctomycetota bacterium]